MSSLSNILSQCVWGNTCLQWYWCLICSCLCNCTNQWDSSPPEWAELTSVQVYTSLLRASFHQNILLQRWGSRRIGVECCQQWFYIADSLFVSAPLRLCSLRQAALTAKAWVFPRFARGSLSSMKTTPPLPFHPSQLPQRKKWELIESDQNGS